MTMTTDQKMQLWTVYNKAYGELRHLANDCRIAGDHNRCAEITKQAEPFKVKADQLYKEMMGEIE
jgi:hypothetical protein